MALLGAAALRADASALPLPDAGGCAVDELLVMLKPMEVRTFELVYRPN